MEAKTAGKENVLHFDVRRYMNACMKNEFILNMCVCVYAALPFDCCALTLSPFKVCSSSIILIQTVVFSCLILSECDV